MLPLPIRGQWGHIENLLSLDYMTQDLVIHGPNGGIQWWRAQLGQAA